MVSVFHRCFLFLYYLRGTIYCSFRDIGLYIFPSFEEGEPVRQANDVEASPFRVRRVYPAGIVGNIVPLLVIRRDGRLYHSKRDDKNPGSDLLSVVVYRFTEKTRLSAPGFCVCAGGDVGFNSNHLAVVYLWNHRFWRDHPSIQKYHCQCGFLRLDPGMVSVSLFPKI